MAPLTKYSVGQVRSALKAELDPELADALVDEVVGALASVGKHGLALGVELRDVRPVDVQGVLVFPDGAAKKKSPLSLLNTLVRMAPGAPVQEVKEGQRTFTHLAVDPVHVVWWAEGKDLVLAIGTDNPAKLAAWLKGAGKTLADNAAYRQLAGFKEFPTWARGYLDLPALGKVAGKLSPEAPKLIDQLGLKSIQSLTFHQGFDGAAERSVVFLNVKGPRKGILRLASPKKFSLQDLPAMPPEARAFSATNLDTVALYDVALGLTESVLRLAEVGGEFDLRQTIQDVERGIGVNIREDLLGSLDSLVVQYNGPGESLLGLGQVSLIKVKDADRLEQALVKLLDAAQKQTGGSLSVKARAYHGAKMYVLDMGQMGGFYVPSFTVHKGWLAISLYPQPVKGFILRAKGELPAWEPGPELQKVLAHYPKQFTGLTVSDPRPSVSLVLSAVPPVMAAVNTFVAQLAPGAQQARFDIDLIPNPAQVTRYLFPNVTVYTDEGKRLRADSRLSLPLPF